MPSSKPITSFTCLTFDCFGTIVDWESGAHTALQPLLNRLPASHALRATREAALTVYAKHEASAQAARPDALYSDILASAYGEFASAELGIAVTDDEKAAFGASVGDWPAFPDSVEALNRLKKHYKLVILSNVDRESFSHTLTRQLPGVQFDAIYTAQDVGAYKPDMRNFHYLLEHCEEDLGVDKDNILHTAQGLRHDHEPAKRIGLASAWIERGRDGPGPKSVMGGTLADYEGKVDFTWHFGSLAEMADEVDARA